MVSVHTRQPRTFSNILEHRIFSKSESRRFNWNLDSSIVLERGISDSRFSSGKAMNNRDGLYAGVADRGARGAGGLFCDQQHSVQLAVGFSKICPLAVE